MMNRSEQLLQHLQMLEKEVWDKDNPNKKHKKMTPAMKSRAKAAGRPWPNLVDAMAVTKGA